MKFNYVIVFRLLVSKGNVFFSYNILEGRDLNDLIFR